MKISGKPDTQALVGLKIITYLSALRNQLQQRQYAFQFFWLVCADTQRSCAMIFNPFASGHRQKTEI